MSANYTSFAEARSLSFASKKLMWHFCTSSYKGAKYDVERALKMYVRRSLCDWDVASVVVIKRKLSLQKVKYFWASSPNWERDADRSFAFMFSINAMLFLYMFWQIVQRSRGPSFHNVWSILPMIGVEKSSGMELKSSFARHQEL